MTRKDLSKLMLRAWEMFRTTGKAFAVCLAKAWALYRLTKRMRSGVVVFCYEKADGTLRRAKGILQGIASLVKGSGTKSPKTFRYFDVEAGGFRAFQIENLIAVY